METQPVLPVKLIIAVLYNQSVNDIKIKEILKPVFGMWDHCSPTHDFNFTDYYHREMGAIEKRLLLSFKKLIKPDDLTHIKLLTNEMEKRFMTNGCRQINFDPGYLDLDKVILASAK